MNVLIIGASGHVGTLVNPLLKQKHILRIYDVKPPADTTLDYWPGDVTNYEKLKRDEQGQSVRLWICRGEYIEATPL